MKKMNSTSKRKWILGGTLGFGAVALLTTGFATWIIGVNQTKGNEDTTVAVDTTKNESAILEVKLSDSSIKLAETKKVDGTFIKTDENPGGDLSITFSKITFTYGKNFLPEGQSVKSINFRLPTETDSELPNVAFTDNTAISTQENSSGLRTDKGPWTYIEAPAAITEGLEPRVEGELNVIELTNKTVEFSWGSYFKKGAEFLSPANYYNAMLGEKETVGIKDLDNVDTELKKMGKAFEGKKIHLLAEVIYN